MLVLTRRPGEGIVIGEGIRVVISKVSGDRVSVGVEADRSVVVLREELVGKPHGDYPKTSVLGVAGVDGGDVGTPTVTS